jgi:diguanylate cyclase (GGDEF)-like protein/PAS domain S-box-containing protein
VEDVKLQAMSKEQLTQELMSLRHRESLFNAAEKMAEIGHCEWDCEHDRLKSCSEEYANIFGMTIEEVTRTQSSWKTWLKQVHPEDRERYELSYRSQSETGSHDIEYKIIRKDGSVRDIHEYAFLVINENGESKEAFGIIQDITQIQQYRRDLEYRDALSQHAEASADIGHFIYNEKNSTYVYISPGYARIHGVAAEEMKLAIKSQEDDLADIVEEDHERVSAVYDQYFEDAQDYTVEYRLKRPDGKVIWVRELSSANRINNGDIEQTLGVLQDISAQKETEALLRETRNSLEVIVEERTQDLVKAVEQLQKEVEEREKIAVELKFHANHDSLTGLPSLRLCKDRLEQSLAESRRNKQMSAVMFVDLDGFKLINDTHGHECGDIVLKTIADRIRVEIRETDTVARIGGDEFLVILSNMSAISITQRVAAKLIEQISKVILYGSEEIEVGASIGIAIYPDDGTTSEEMIQQADKAMYLVKHSGKNNFGFTQTRQLD